MKNNKKNAIKRLCTAVSILSFFGLIGVAGGLEQSGVTITKTITNATIAIVVLLIGILGYILADWMI
jgi:hypothetical protein